MSVTIPDYIFEDMRNEAQDLAHGVVHLELHVRDYNVHFYKVNREKSKVVTPSQKKAEGSPPNSLHHKELRNARPRNERRV